MKRIMMLLVLLMLSAIVMGGDKTNDNSKCLETCKKNCQKSYDNCMKNAKTDGKRTACKQSLDQCNSVCVNKTCR